jgi:hypothetical protein
VEEEEVEKEEVDNEKPVLLEVCKGTGPQTLLGTARGLVMQDAVDDFGSRAKIRLKCRIRKTRISRGNLEAKVAGVWGKVVCNEGCGIGCHGGS